MYIGTILYTSLLWRDLESQYVVAVVGANCDVAPPKKDTKLIFFSFFFNSREFRVAKGTKPF